MNISFYINSKEVKVSEDTKNSLNLDFSYDSHNPNSKLLEELEIELIRSNDEFDGFNYIKELKRSNNMVNPSILIVENTLNKTIFKGKILLNSPRNRTNDFKGTMLLLCKNNYESFESLFGTNLRSLGIDKSIYNITPVLKQDPNPEVKLLTILNTIQLLVNEGDQLVTDVTKLVGDIAGGITGLAVAIIKSVVLATRVTLFIIKTGIFLKQFNDLVLPPVKFYNSVSLVDLLTESLKKVNYKLERLDLPDARYYDLNMIASTEKKPKVNRSKTDNNPIPNITLGDLVDYVRTQFNLTYKVIENKVIFANIDYFEAITNDYQLERLQDEGSYYPNYFELYKSVSFKYQKRRI